MSQRRSIAPALLPLRHPGMPSLAAPHRIVIIHPEAARWSAMLPDAAFHVCAMSGSALEVEAIARRELPDALILDAALLPPPVLPTVVEAICAISDCGIILLSDEDVSLPGGDGNVVLLDAEPSPRQFRCTLDLMLRQRNAGQRYEHLREVLQAIRGIEQLINRETDRQRLLDETCRILQGTQDYRLVWIGEARTEGCRVVPVARAGIATEYLDHVEITWDERPTGQGPTGRAIREKRLVVRRDLANDPKFTPWKHEAGRHGFVASAAIPIIQSGRVFGALNVYTSRQDCFDIDEELLLVEIAADLALALRALQEESARNAAEQRLEAAQTRYHQLFDVIPDGIFAADETGRFREVNPGACAQLGYTRDELLTMTVGDISTRMGFEITQLVDMLRRVKSRSIQTTHRRKDGTHFPVELSLSLVETSDGLRIVGVARDVTERSQSLAARERLAAILDVTPDFVAIADPRGQLLYLNKAARKILGVGPGEDISQSRAGRGHPEWGQRLVVETAIPTAIRDGIWTGENAFLDADGYEIPYSQIILAHTDGDGQLAFVSTICRDLSPVKALEERLRHAQKMEAVGRLAGGIAHDFNNILTAISGFVELAMLDLVPAHPARESLVEIGRATNRAAELTGQLLAFSRKQVLRPQMLDFSRVVADTMPLIERLLGEDVILDLRLAPLLGQVKADPAQVEQVLMNLAVNARDAMPGGGRLTIRTDRITRVPAEFAVPDDHRDRPHLVLTVADTGVGMNAETLAHVFEPFFTTKAIGQGTGLGLATVHGIVEQSGGRIHVSSTPGHGTAFQILLPLLDAPADTVFAMSPASVPPKGSETILVVEDQAAVREITQRLLERQGYTVHVAEDGPSALLLAASLEQPIHLLLTDVVMPDMSGPELARELLLLRPGIQVLLMSGHVTDAIRERGLAEGNFPLLQKPFSAAALASAIRGALDPIPPDTQA